MREPTTEEMLAHLACDGDLRARIAHAAIPGHATTVLRDMADSLRRHFRVAADGAIVPAQVTFLAYYGGDFGTYTPITDKE